MFGITAVFYLKATCFESSNSATSFWVLGSDYNKRPMQIPVYVRKMEARQGLWSNYTGSAQNEKTLSLEFSSVITLPWSLLNHVPMKMFLRYHDHRSNLDLDHLFIHPVPKDPKIITLCVMYKIYFPYQIPRMMVSDETSKLREIS